MEKSYKYKYRKYKSKYLDLKNQLGSAMGSELEIRPLEDRIEDPYDDSVGYTNVAKAIPQTDRTPDSSEVDFQDDEVFYKLEKLNSITDREFTKKLEPNMFSILKISNTKIFDEFTNKYGTVEGDAIKIDWSRVADDFEGLYLSPEESFKRQRFDKAPYNNQEYESWWEDEWNVDDVLVFTKSDVTHIPALLPDSPLPVIEEKMPNY